MTYKKMILLCIQLLLTLMMIACDNSDTAAGGSGGEMKVAAGLYGRFVDNTNTPVRGALVRVYEKDTTVVASLYTDSAGEYLFTTLKAGTYSLRSEYHGESDTLTAFVKSIVYDTLYYVGEVIMREPGKIHGQVILEEQNREGVKCYIPGTSYDATTDSLGYFTITTVPADLHSLSFRQNGYAIETITNILVLSDSTTDIGVVTLTYDTTLNPATVTNVDADYNPTTGLCSITWKPVNVADLVGYILYGKSTVDQNLIILDTILDPGNGYTDSLWQRVYKLENKEYIYQLKALDNDNNVSDSYSEVKRVTPDKGPFTYLSPVLHITFDQQISDISPSKAACSIFDIEVVDSSFSYGKFNGISSYMTVEHLPVHNVGAGSFSTTFWINAAPHDAPILSKFYRSLGTPETGWNIQVEYGDGVLGGEDIYGSGVRLDMSDGAHGKWALLSAGYGSTNNQWHHMAIIIDRETQRTKLYQDGLLIESADISNIGSAETDDPFMIGWRTDVGYRYFEGGLADIRVYDYAIDEEQIDLIMKNK